MNSIERLRVHLQHTVIGQQRLLDRLLIAVLTGGHVLIEGLPGLAKTTAVRTLAGGLALGFQRIQFTPDMIPGDITGSDIFLPQDGQFQFIPGPVFNEIILADEINRAPPKVQSALLEAMQERQVTVGGTTRALPAIFLVIATQNPIEQEGTYPLPEAQLDRFQMKVRIDFPPAEDELKILHLERDRRAGAAEPAPADPVLAATEVLELRRVIDRLYLDEMLERYIIVLVGATREPARWDAELAEWLTRGASPRASLALAHTARAQAVLAGRDFVEPDDILQLAPDVLNHRIGLSFAARAAGVTAEQVIERIVACVPIP
jgi:MoxR-like ATPase